MRLLDRTSRGERAHPARPGHNEEDQPNRLIRGGLPATSADDPPQTDARGPFCAADATARSGITRPTRDSPPQLLRGPMCTSTRPVGHSPTAA
jgi:hypothetical protein